jgi:hypothetical protein
MYDRNIAYRLYADEYSYKVGVMKMPPSPMLKLLRVTNTRAPSDYMLTARRTGMVLVLLLLAACARHYTSSAVESSYGFFSGIWHGVIFPLSLLANLVSWFLSLFDIHVMESIQIIGRPNTGFFYYFGFVIGLSCNGGAGGAASR